MKKLLIATGNKGKFKEFCEYLNSDELTCISTNGYSIVEPVENGVTFEENALIKAKYYYEHTNLPSLADDSGLIVDQLDGEPGIFSARWAGEDKNFSMAINKIKKKLEEKKIDLNKVTGSFYCSLCLYGPAGVVFEASAKTRGKLVFPARGNNGFGYDPIFIAEGNKLTFAEMTDIDKKRFSHRARALVKIKEYL